MMSGFSQSTVMGDIWTRNDIIGRNVTRNFMLHIKLKYS